MRVNPVNFNVVKSSDINKKPVKPDISEVKVQEPKVQGNTVAYPRRYLPNYYPAAQKETYDSFTGMRDKNYLMAVIRNHIADSSVKQTNLSIAMFDMDNFKSVNELLGYKTGDDFIKEISKQIMISAIANSIHAYRFGGEEFVLVFGNQSKDKQNEIVKEIIKNVNNNEFIKSKETEYRENAQKKLDEYYQMHEKISNLVPLKTKRTLLTDLKQNLATEEAKNDEYLTKSINETNEEIKKLYLTLIDERLSVKEEDSETQDFLSRVKTDLEEKDGISQEDEDELTEYMLSIYDKTFEIHQIKKWLQDFNKNKGFSITGGLVVYSPDAVKGKKPLDIINDAGEAIKQGKSMNKGQIYYNSFK